MAGLPPNLSGKQWKKRSQKALLAQPTEVHLTADEQKSEKDRPGRGGFVGGECSTIGCMNMSTFQDAAFDLLDAITKCLGLKGMDPLMEHIRTCYQRSWCWG